jgi:hypothetical protein
MTVDIADDAEITRELIKRMARDIVAMTAALESQAGHPMLGRV